MLNRFSANVASRVAITTFGLALVCWPAAAQQPTVPFKRLGMDAIRLSTGDAKSHPGYSGERLLGFIIGRDQQAKISLAVERKWLETTYPELAESKNTADKDSSAAAKQVLIDRIQVWMKERKKDGPLCLYLEEQINALETQGTAPDSKFVVFRLAADQISSTKTASPENRHIAGIAFQNDLENVSTRSAALLEKELKSQGIDAKKSQVDLTHDLPAGSGESEGQWKVRQALIEHSYREPLEYQGTGNKFYKSGGDANLMQVASDMLGSGGGSIAQLGAELGLPEFRQATANQNAWWENTCKAAEAAGFRGVLIKRLETKPLSASATVEVHFFAMQKPGSWVKVFRHSRSCNAAEVTEDQLQRLKQDPQVQSIETMTSGLGLSLGGKLDQALRMGAATQTALSWASASFEQFLAKHLDRLDKPAIMLP